MKYISIFLLLKVLLFSSCKEDNSDNNIKVIPPLNESDLNVNFEDKINENKKILDGVESSSDELIENTHRLFSNKTKVDLDKIDSSDISVFRFKKKNDSGQRSPLPHE